LFFPFPSIPVAPRRHILALDDQLLPSLWRAYLGLSVERHTLKTPLWTFLPTPPKANADYPLLTKPQTSHGSIDHQQLLRRKRPNICIRATPIDRNLIHCQSSPEIRPLQITSFMALKSQFRRQVQTIGKSLRHAQDMKSAACLTRKGHRKFRTAKPSSACANETSSLACCQQLACKLSEKLGKQCSDTH
jgi:hypothetical protein